MSGARAGVVAALSELEQRGAKVRPLSIRYGFHSALMDGVMPALGRALERITFSEPQLTIVSNVSGKTVERGEMTRPDYWTRQLRSAVRFMDGIHTLHGRGVTHFVEVGPKPTLSGMGRRCVTDETLAWLPALRENQPDTRQMRETLAALYSAGHRVSWANVSSGGSRRRLALPTYPFERRRYWREVAPPTARAEAHVEGGEGDPKRPLHGVVLSARAPGIQVVESLVDASCIAQLREHRFYDQPIASGAFQLGVVIGAEGQLRHSGETGTDPTTEAVELSEIAFQAPMHLDSPRRMQIVFSSAGDDGRTRFEIRSTRPSTEDWTVHAGGVLARRSRSPERLDIESIKSRCPTRKTSEEFYAAWRDEGQHLGESIRLVDGVWLGDGEALAHLARPTPPEIDDPERPDMHDALLLETYAIEAGTQALKSIMPAGLTEGGERVAYIAVGADRIARNAPGIPCWSHVELISANRERIVVTLRMTNAEGEVLWVQERVVAQRIDQRTFARVDAQSKARGPTIPVPDLAKAESTARVGLMVDYLTAVFGHALGAPVGEIDPLRSTRQLGMDSLTATEINGTLKRDLQCELSVADLLEGLNLRDLGSRLVGRLFPDDSPAPKGPMRNHQGTWLVRSSPTPSPRMRLFCFPYGGGGASIFYRWKEDLPSWVDVVGIQLPGREERLSEPPISDLRTLLPLLEREVLAAVEDGVPFAFYGCSMGALAAFELARRLRRAGLSTPEHLFLAAFPAPHTRVRIKELSIDPATLRGAETLLPARLFENEELMAVMRPTLAADFVLVRDWTSESTPLDTPITVFGGENDVHVRPDELSGWSTLTSVSFERHILPGEHLFMESHRPELLAIIRRALVQRYGAE